MRESAPYAGQLIGNSLKLVLCQNLYANCCGLMYFSTKSVVEEEDAQFVTASLQAVHAQFFID